MQRNDRQRVNTNGGTQSIAKIVKQVLNSNVEKKWKTTTFSSGVDNTLTNTDLSSISNGNTVNTRVGASIRATRLRLKWYAVIGDTTNIIRVVLHYWKPNDAVDVPQQSELFQNSSILSPLLKLNPNRFKMIRDLYITMDQYHPTQSGELDIKLAELISYMPGLDTGLNHVYLSVISDSGGVPNPTFSFDASLDFVDE